MVDLGCCRAHHRGEDEHRNKGGGLAAILTVTMRITDPAWMAPYSAGVPALLAEYGGSFVASARGTIRRIEGEGDVPDRIAIFSFPSIEAIERLWADPRYRQFVELRQSGAISDICAFDNAAGGDLV